MAPTTSQDVFQAEALWRPASSGLRDRDVCAMNLMDKLITFVYASLGVMIILAAIAGFTIAVIVAFPLGLLAILPATFFTAMGLLYIVLALDL